MKKPLKIAFTAAYIGAVAGWALLVLPRASAQNGPAAVDVRDPDTSDMDATPADAKKTAPAFDSSLIENWPDKPRAIAKLMTEKYGPPNESTPTMLVWRGNGPWIRTVVYRDETDHLFPVKHTDFLEQTVAYKVPVDKIGELAKFDGSILVDRTKGELSARCDKETNNTLALNLAVEIANGKRSAASAREFMTKAVQASANGKSSPYFDALRFSSQAPGPAAEPDSTTVK
jgi:hypothetical protein